MTDRRQLYFSGTHEYALDAKGRVAIPSRFREQLIQADGHSLYLAPAVQERHLKLYPRSAWEHLRTRLEAISNPHKRRAFMRTILSRSHEVSLDSQGRVLIPQGLREYAELSGETLIVGEGDHVQFWSPRNWNAALDAALEEVADSGSLLADLGF